MSEDVIERVDDLVRKNNQKYKSKILWYSRLNDSEIILAGYQGTLERVQVLTN